MKLMITKFCDISSHNAQIVVDGSSNVMYFMHDPKLYGLKLEMAQEV